MQIAIYLSEINRVVQMYIKGVVFGSVSFFWVGLNISYIQKLVYKPTENLTKTRQIKNLFTIAMHI